MGTFLVTVYGEQMIARFARKHATARKPLTRFLEQTRQATWKHLMDLKQTFPTADYSPTGVVIFDIGGNKYRVVAKVEFEEQIVDIRKVLTHEEYSREEL